MLIVKPCALIDIRRLRAVSASCLPLANISEMTEDFDKQVFKHPLNPESYRLAEDEIAFHKAQTGIQDDEELKSHIIAVQRDAYEAGSTFSPGDAVPR